MKKYMGTKHSKISVWTAHHWLRKLDWCYQKKKTGMYVDGHEREDVVAYRKAFLGRWHEYERQMVTYDQDGAMNTMLEGFDVPGGCFRLILITHDESMFYSNDWQKTKWTHGIEKPTPECKGEGVSLVFLGAGMGLAAG